MKNDRFFKAETIEQFKIIKYINVCFEDGALDLALLDRSTICGTDCNGEKILFYYDYETGKVKVTDA